MNSFSSQSVRLFNSWLYRVCSHSCPSFNSSALPCLTFPMTLGRTRAYMIHQSWGFLLLSMRRGFNINTMTNMQRSFLRSLNRLELGSNAWALNRNRNHPRVRTCLIAADLGAKSQFKP
ncbi:hypothetical protein DAEQUDRAFT_537140 [Daedalea quercina L-15889]|uniref:Uncharacterized protein n=1 Tax=Daedalea quercina L-15889 TaxID=1314783 RepID=A0A165M5I9_9APHY|nr:hypothetical protein DAEQUDRAFT_537140 [Daedalea quercina L-15889]